MDAELLELQKQFETAQQAKSSVRLSERNVVELVQKLQELKFIDFDLLHTVSGKEYITPVSPRPLPTNQSKALNYQQFYQICEVFQDQLKHEIEVEIKRSGRISLIDLSDVIGVDLYHVERIAQQVVASDSGLMIVNGEIVSEAYWDSAAEEIDEKLQECSQIALAEIAAQLQVGSELVVSILEPRIGSIVRFFLSSLTKSEIKSKHKPNLVP